MIGNKKVICALAIDKQEDLIYIEKGQKKASVVITVEHKNK